MKTKHNGWSEEFASFLELSEKERWKIIAKDKLRWYQRLRWWYLNRWWSYVRRNTSQPKRGIDLLESLYKGRF